MKELENEVRKVRNDQGLLIMSINTLYAYFKSIFQSLACNSTFLKHFNHTITFFFI